MPFQVVHAHHRFAQRCGHGTGHSRPYQQRTSEARAARVGDHVNVFQAFARLR